jgi:uncharacterized protein YggU (UPF0235/DUF167 family)
MTGAPRIFDITSEGLRLRIRLTPGASKASMDGVVELPDGRWALRLRVAAKPVDGAANDALIALLAAALDRPRSSLRVAVGQTSRLKIVEVEGNTADLAGRILAWIDGATRPDGSRGGRGRAGAGR